MDRAKCRLIREKLEEVLSLVEDDLKALGLTAVIGRHASYTHANATFKVEVSELGQDGQAQTKEVEAFKQGAVLYGLKPEDLGRKFRGATGTFEICGLSPKSRKYPILAKDHRGKVYKFAPTSVKLYMAATN